MRSIVKFAASLTFAALVPFSAPCEALAQRCAPVCRPQPVCGGGGSAVIGVGGSFGNAGFGAGYSIQIGRTVSATSWCGPGFVSSYGGRGYGAYGAYRCGSHGYGYEYGSPGSGCGYAAGCGPRWCGPCGPRFWNGCNPCGYGGWSLGWPGYGIGGWSGGGSWLGGESVFVAGGGTLFSGGVRPWAMPWPWWYGGYPATWWPGYAVTPFGTFFTPYGTLLPPGAGPRFGPAGIFPLPGFAGARRADARGSRPVANERQAAGADAITATASQVRRERTVRAVTASGRRRAAGHVAKGDRLLREAGADPVKLRTALAAYRQAAAAERDQPDTCIRQAIVLAALGDRAGVDAALATAVTLDGRLASGARTVATADADPIFGGPRDVAPLAVRGHAIIMEIAGGAAVDDAPLAWLADSWSASWVDGIAGLAANGP